MATTLIDTRQNIRAQVEASFKNAPEGAYLTEKDSVYKRNAVWANKLIRLYLELNIEVEHRWALWQFFEVKPSGVVNWVKDQIARLKLVKRVLKKQQKLGCELANATDLFTCRNDVSIYAVLDDVNRVKIQKHLQLKSD